MWNAFPPPLHSRGVLSTRGQSRSSGTRNDGGDLAQPRAGVGTAPTSQAGSHCPVQNNRGDCVPWLFTAAFGDFLMIHFKWFGQATLLYNSAYNLVCFPLCAVTDSAAAYAGFNRVSKSKNLLPQSWTYRNIGESVRRQETSLIN